MLKLLDIFFVTFHTLLVLFNLFGWITKKTRLANLITLSLTAASWFILGLFYGIGYCPLTGWHFQVLYKLGHSGLPNSYIKYIFDRLTGSDVDPMLVEFLTGLLFAMAFAASLIMNIRDWRIQAQKSKNIS